MNGDDLPSLAWKPVLSVVPVSRDFLAGMRCERRNMLDSRLVRNQYPLLGQVHLSHPLPLQLYSAFKPQEYSATHTNRANMLYHRGPAQTRFPGFELRNIHLKSASRPVNHRDEHGNITPVAFDAY